MLRWGAWALAVLAACGGRPAGESGRLAAAGLGAGLDLAAREKTPWRCARGASSPMAIAAAGGPSAGAGDPPLAIGVVAGARGPAGVSDATVAALGELRAGFARAHVRAVFADGGMGTSEAELERSLGALVDPGWTVVAIPGDAESVPGLRAAVAALHAKGGAIVDGAATRAFDLGALKVATLPGAPFASRLAAGPDGCVRDKDDIDATLAGLPGPPPGVARAKPAPRILISATAPRQRGDGGSDLAPGGVHAGEPDLAAALVQAPVDLVVHPQLGPPPAAGAIGGDTPRPRAVAAGIADAPPRYDDTGRLTPPTAIVVLVDPSGIRWQPLAPVASLAP